MVRLPQASRPRQVACVSIVNVSMHTYRDHGVGRAARPGWLFAFQNPYAYSYIQGHGNIVPRQAALAGCLFPIVYVGLHMYGDGRAGLDSPPLVG